MYVDAAYCYPVAWSVGLSVCYISEPCKNGLTDRDALWVEDLGGPRNQVLKMGVQIFHGKEEKEGWLIVKYRHCDELCKNGCSKRDVVSVMCSDRPKESLYWIGCIERAILWGKGGPL